MKGITVFLLFSASAGFSQSENDSIYRNVDESALFQGGYGEMIKYIAKHINYPPCIPDEINTHSYIQFVIEKNGTVSNVMTLKPSECDICDKETVRVVNTMPLWIPAKRNGEAVRSYVVIPYHFR